MWSFVVQNFYINNMHKTRRLNALKKLHFSYYYPVLVKISSTKSYYNVPKYYNTYYWIYNSVFKKTFWAFYNSLLFKNQGLVYNNLTLSYYHSTVSNLASNMCLKATSPKSIDIEAVSTLNMPFSKTTFNSLVYISYSLLSSYYPTHFFWFKLLHTYSWLTRYFIFDIAVNTFYFKIYKY